MMDTPPPIIKDQTMLSAEQQQKVVDALNRKVPNSGKCPVCLPGHYNVAAHMVALTVQSFEGSAILGGPSYPCVQLLCDNCGHVRLHNALILGVLDEQPKGTAA